MLNVRMFAVIAVSMSVNFAVIAKANTSRDVTASWMERLKTIRDERKVLILRIGN